MNFEKVNEVGCAPMPAIMPKENIKDITGTNYKAVCEINVVLSAIEAQTFGINEAEPDTPREDTLEAALIGTNKILDNIVGRLHQFADRMGVQI
nr:MAG TPA: hypothetical protein [Caudoviricetes sp.]